jgi:hypothetical protein
VVAQKHLAEGENSLAPWHSPRPFFPFILAVAAFAKQTGDAMRRKYRFTSFMVVLMAGVAIRVLDLRAEAWRADQ